MYTVETYRDLQWQIYNVQQLHLNALTKILKLNVNDNFKEFPENWAMIQLLEMKRNYWNKILKEQAGDDDERIYFGLFSLI